MQVLKAIVPSPACCQAPCNHLTRGIAGLRLVRCLITCRPTRGWRLRETMSALPQRQTNTILSDAIPCCRDTCLSFCNLGA